MKKYNDGGSMPKLTDKEKKMGDALMMTKRGKQVMDAQKRMEADKEKADAAKRARADKLLGVGMKKGGMMADKAGRAMTRKTADTMGRAMVKKAGGGKCYAAGGLTSGHKSADGVASKGKTKGKMVKMAMGGGLGGMGLRRMSTAAPKPQGMGANMMRRKKGGSC